MTAAEYQPRACPERVRPRRDDCVPIKRRLCLGVRYNLFVAALVAALLLAPANLLAAASGAQEASSARRNSAPDEPLSKAATEARERGDAVEAIPLYRQALAARPDWTDGWWFLGSLAYGTDDYITAEQALTRYLRLKPHAAPALALRGLSRYHTLNYLEALADIEEALRLGAGNEPRNEQLLRLHQGLLLTRGGEFERALQVWILLAQQGITTPAATLGLGLAGLRIAALPSELPADQQDLAFAAGQAATALIAATHLTSGNVDAASPAADKEFAAFFARYPSVPNAHYFHGYLLFAGNPDRAASEFRQELAISPGSAPAAAMLAWVALMRSDPGAALPFGEQAVRSDPALPLAQLTLGRSLVETGSIGAGIDHLERARQLEPSNLEAHMALARAYSSANRPSEARTERLLCLQLTQDHAPKP